VECWKIDVVEDETTPGVMGLPFTMAVVELPRGAPTGPVEVPAACRMIDVVEDATT
jgi:hypothetical protein